MEARFRAAAAKEARARYRTPEIFYGGPGPQFTGTEFTEAPGSRRENSARYRFPIRRAPEARGRHPPRRPPVNERRPP
jgi:hypothetical protein